MAIGVPVLVNGACSVLAGHCKKSGAGITYRTYEEFEKGLESLLQDEKEYQRMSAAGRRYVNENYNWDRTVEKYRKLIER
jgi:glycosyltransferase involved in cell wall biosynthesis